MKKKTPKKEKTPKVIVFGQEHPQRKRANMAEIVRNAAYRRAIRGFSIIA